METKRYALWLLPEEPLAQQLTEQIDTLARTYGGPRFTPHVTLFGRTSGDEQELVAKVEALARQLAPLSLRADGLEVSAYYFRSLYLRLQKSPELLRMGQIVSKELGLRMNSDYDPHLSLLYGAMPRADKKAARERVNGQLPGAITLDRLQLVEMSVAVPDWRVVSTVQLNG